MELMDISLDKFYKFTYGHLKVPIPEEILGKITVAVSNLALQVQYYLDGAFCIDSIEHMKVDISL